MDRRREAVVHRSVFHQRRDRQARGQERRPEHHRRVFGDDAVRELHRNGRLGLIVQ
jgi:hypothetical protein